MTPPVPQPSTRRLRVYAFDPNASLDLGTNRFAHATIALAWNDPLEQPVSIGPVNEYLEVIDIDPCSRQFYAPVDLNAADVLAQDGLPPSEGDPRFHQQMVFAVAMKTIKLFERALGRKVLWAPTWDTKRETYVATLKLRVYPHALREANAYYSHDKRALLFGYFPATRRSAGANWIFTALSHDIIVHETTHAILDGLHPRYAEPTSPDSLAFHEAFADIAALFSHFQLAEAVSSYIAGNAGRLDQSGLLSGLAGQFAAGTTGRASLRDYIDKKPDPDLLEGTREPHERGATLVAAVFDAFLTIYNARTVDLLRMTGADLGTGGHLHPDLVARLTQEAGKAADHCLRMCIRALDYLPPVDVRFGEFLRAIITADTDLIPDDRLDYRLAFVQAFRERGIFPENCLSMSPDNLLWNRSPLVGDPGYLEFRDIQKQGLDLVPRFRRSEIFEITEMNRRMVWFWLLQPELRLSDQILPADNDRLQDFLVRARRVLAQGSADAPERAIRHFIDDETDIWTWLKVPAERIEPLTNALLAAPSYLARWQLFLDRLADPAFTPRIAFAPDIDQLWERALGLFFKRPASGNRLYTIAGDDAPDPDSAPGEAGLKVEVASVRTTRRSGPDGEEIRQLVIEVTQRRRGYLDVGEQARHDGQTPSSDTETGTDGAERGDFWFRGGATVIVDLRENTLRYVIRKRIDDDDRLARQRQHLLDGETMGFTYDRGLSSEPFAMMHRG